MIALFGGTFNPIHNGHIALAREVAAAFNLKQVDILPSYQSVHRAQPMVSTRMREQMVKLAISPYSELKLNTLELERAGPSYAIDTLKQIKQQSARQTVCWLMGVDAFNGFLNWKDAPGILQLAHLIVCTRPGSHIDHSIFRRHQLSPQQSLEQYPAGKIAFFRMQPNDCSSTRIRHQLKSPAERLSATVTGCLAKPVLEFIQQHKLYET